MNRPCAAVMACAMIFLGVATSQACEVTAQSELQAVFTPWGNIEGEIIHDIEQAQKQVLVQAYLLTSRKIAASLIKAHRRGVDVRVLADAQQQLKAESSRLPDLSAAGIPVWLETKYQNAHNKIVLIDPESSGPTVITGSFNFTWTAQHRNAENILVVRNNPCVASRYLANWERHQSEAISYGK